MSSTRHSPPCSRARPTLDQARLAQVAAGLAQARSASSDTEPPFSALRFMLAKHFVDQQGIGAGIGGGGRERGLGGAAAGRSTLTTYTSEVLRCTPGSMRTRTRTSLSALLAVLAGAGRAMPTARQRCQLVLNSPVCGALRRYGSRCPRRTGGPPATRPASAEPAPNGCYRCAAGCSR